jgi:hypothetical protein
MGQYKLRLAKLSDAKDIANLHYTVREQGALGIFARMGKPFIRKYYKVVLDDPNEIIVCAENKKGQIAGFNSYTLDAKAQMNNLRKNKIGLIFAALSSVIVNPKLIKPLIDRYKSMRKNSSTQYFVREGARAEYWVWSAAEKDPIESIDMQKACADVLRALGVEELFYEVDVANKKVMAYHKLMKSIIIDTIILPDGRERCIIKCDLNRKK